MIRGDEQFGHNNSSPTKLNSIHHKRVINTDKVEGMNSTIYNTSCNGETRWDGDGDGDDDDDLDLDDARDDGDDDADDLPLREVFSSAESVRWRWLFLLCRFPPQGGGETPYLLLL